MVKVQGAISYRSRSLKYCIKPKFKREWKTPDSVGSAMHTNCTKAPYLMNNPSFLIQLHFTIQLYYDIQLLACSILHINFIYPTLPVWGSLISLHQKHKQTTLCYFASKFQVLPHSNLCHGGS